MQGKLQQSYRVSKELGQNSEFEGSLTLSQMPRLSSLVMPGDAPIKIRFEFTKNLYQHPSITGHIETRLQLECQRCLEPMEQIMDFDFDLLIDASDEDVKAFQTDTLVSDGGYIDIVEVVEDELILALPLISMHEDTACHQNWQPDELPAPEAGKDNPFAALAALKGKRTEDGAS